MSTRLSTRHMPLHAVDIANVLDCGTSHDGTTKQFSTSDRYGDGGDGRLEHGWASVLDAMVPGNREMVRHSC